MHWTGSSHLEYGFSMYILFKFQKMASVHWHFGYPTTCFNQSFGISARITTIKSNNLPSLMTRGDLYYNFASQTESYPFFLWKRWLVKRLYSINSISQMLQICLLSPHHPHDACSPTAVLPSCPTSTAIFKWGKTSSNANMLRRCWHDQEQCTCAQER